MVMDQKMKEVISKVEKLLRLAKSDNENEAKLALQRAQELQQKYKFSIEEVEVEEEERVEELEVESPDTKTLNSLFTQMAAHLNKHYQVMLYIQHNWDHVGKHSKKLRIVGLPVDVEIFKQVLFFAYNSMRKMADLYVKSLPAYYTRSQKSGSKNDYCYGFMKGMAQALRKNEQEMALMVITPEAVVKYMDEKSRDFRKGEAPQRTTNHDYKAFTTGQQDGESIMKEKPTNRLT